MAYEQRDNSGALFRNDKKETEAHPHATGTATIGGVKYRVAAWTKTRMPSGERWQSLSFTPVDVEKVNTDPISPNARSRATAAEIIDDDIQF